MTISSLEKVSLDEIVNVFNRAFADYVIRVKLNKTALEQRILTENISLPHSVGTFVNGRLVGFILHAHDELKGKKVLYNAGTGVLPENRGQSITEKMYDYSIPKLRMQGVERCHLEVIDTNNKAIHVYVKIGFQIRRDLSCFKGVVYFNRFLRKEGLEVVTLEEPDWFLFPTFWNNEPTWQNSIPVINRAEDLYQTIGIRDGSRMIGYGMINPKTGRIPQFGIHPEFRRRGIGKMLFSYLCRMGNTNLSVINVDKSDRPTALFLHSLGMNIFAGQYEMVLKV